jgi:hypothetical protein
MSHGTGIKAEENCDLYKVNPGRRGDLGEPQDRMSGQGIAKNQVSDTVFTPFFGRSIKAQIMIQPYLQTRSLGQGYLSTLGRQDGHRASYRSESQPSRDIPEDRAEDGSASDTHSSLCQSALDIGIRLNLPFSTHALALPVFTWIVDRD